MRCSILHGVHSAAALLLPMAPFASMMMATLGVAAQAEQELEITKPTLKIILEAAKLSQLAYESDLAQFTVGAELDGQIVYAHPDFDEIHFYTDEPDQAIVAKSKDGLCYLAFRGTNPNADDWAQNINTAEANIYKDGDASSSEFCEARAGYADFLQTPEVQQGTADLFNCIGNCTDPANCLVITGHSQGGATANVAAIVLYSAQPTVVTFGQPPALKADCSLIQSDRYYRIVNSRTETGETDDIGFDPVPVSDVLSELFSKSVHYGHYLMLGDDTGGVKYLGFNQERFTAFSMDVFDQDILTHKMPPPDQDEQFPSSYLVHIEGLYNNLDDGSTLQTTGFTAGTVCENGYAMLCHSGMCENNFCKAKFVDNCVKGSCEKDEDCESGFCIWDSCAAGEGQVDDGCSCGRNGNCRSGDCDTKLTSLDWVCEVGAGTDPDADTGTDTGTDPDADTGTAGEPGTDTDTAGEPGTAGEGTTSGDSSIRTKQTSSAAAALGLVFLGYFFM